MARKGIQLCYPFEESRLLKWKVDHIFWQPKLDGDRCRALLTTKRINLLSSQENDRNFALPHIAEQLDIIADVFRSNGIFELDGENYIHGVPHERIHGICSRDTNRHPDYQSMEYHIFDHIVSNTAQEDRFIELLNVEVRNAVSSQPNIKIVPTIPMHPELDIILPYYHVAIDSGYEGMIIRHPYADYHRKRSSFIMKFKPKREDVYEIIGIKEEHTISGEPKGMLGSFICRDEEGTEFSVSAGITRKEKRTYWEIRKSLIGKSLKVYYQAVTSLNKPKFATDLEVI